MPDFTLTAKPLLGGHAKIAVGLSLTEIVDLAIVSIAVPRGGEKALNGAMEKAFGCPFPVPGRSSRSANGATRFLGLQLDQAFAVFTNDEADATHVVAERLGDAGYLTLQSDNWVAMRVSGPLVRDVLARICPVDLHDRVFEVGQVARTVMEHMGTIILREDADTFLLLSASSSARSFLHAIETSIDYVA